MGFLNDELSKALYTGDYICSDCGAKMFFEDEVTEDVLICPDCGHSVDLEHYGIENEEDYDALYPTREEVCGYDDYGSEENETYDEVCGELSDN